jgi:hypothetical protein
MPRARKIEPTCASALKWLAANLGGKRALAPLTGTDYRALAAAAHTIELWAVSGNDRVLEGFRVAVLEMQPRTRYFAYHIVAHMCEWSTRARVWSLARLPLDDLVNIPRCEGES